MVKDSLRPLFEKEGIVADPAGGGRSLVVDEIRRGAPPVRSRSSCSRNLIATAGTTATPRSKSTAIPTADRKLEPVFRRTVDLDSLPVLASHVIDGHAVLPMAIMLEWLAEGAVHRNPGLVVTGIDDLRLLKGVILNPGPQTSVEVRVGKAVRHGSQFIVPTELKGIVADGREVAHARADIILADRYTTGSRMLSEAVLHPYPNLPADIYRSILFHGPAMQGIERVEGLGDRAVAGWVVNCTSARGVARSTAAKRMADRSPGHRLCLSARRSLVPRSAGSKLAANRYRQLSPVPPPLSRRGSSDPGGDLPIK